MRAPSVAVFVLLASVQGKNLIGHVYDGQALAERFSEIASDAANFVALIIFMYLPILRARPVARAEGLRPRVAALIGSYGIAVLLNFAPRAEPSMVWEVASASIAAIGEIGIVVVLLHLGRSFSMMAEARRLVTSGPYHFVRHPLYAVEQITILGVFLQFRSVTAAVFVVAHFLIQVERMRNEEAVLAQTFPEYDDYKQRTSRIIPGVF